MKILFYQHQYPAYGGIETVTTLLAKVLADDGHEVRIVSFIHKDGTTLLEQLSASVRWLPLPEGALDSPANRIAFREILDTFAPDRIIFQDSYANIQTLLFDVVKEWREKVATNPPVAAVAQGATEPQLSSGRKEPPWWVATLKSLVVLLLSPYFRWRRRTYERNRRRNLLVHTSRYVTLSPAYSEIIQNLVGEVYTSGKILSIPNPVIAKGAPYDSTRKRKEILFVGSLIKIKGVHRILLAWQQLFRSYLDWELVVVGDGAEREALEAMARNLQLERVRFEGFTSYPERYYESASIFVMASDFEGFPMVLGEAMSHGVVPVIYDSFAAAREIVQDGVAGFALPAYSQRKFCAQLSALMGDERLLRHHAEACLKRAEAFAMNTVKTQWETLLEELKDSPQGIGQIIVCEHSAPRV